MVLAFVPSSSQGVRMPPLFIGSGLPPESLSKEVPKDMLHDRYQPGCFRSRLFRVGNYNGRFSQSEQSAGNFN
jgi:hypothetical protein